MSFHSVNYRTKFKHILCKNLFISKLGFRIGTFAILLLSFLGFQTSAQSQTDTILNNYRQYKQSQIDSVVNFTSKSKKYAWLNLVPAPMWSTRTGFGLSVNVSTLSNYYQSKKANQIELERLKFEMNNSLENLILGLETKLNIIYSDIENFKIETENFKNEESIYQIEFGKYKNNQSTLKDWLTYKNSYSAKQLALSTKKASLKNRIISFSKQIKNADWASALINSF